MQSSASGSVADLSRRHGRPRSGANRSIALTLLTTSALSLLAMTQGAADPAGLTLDQQAIIAKIAKPPRGENVRYAGALPDPVGAEVRLPFGEGKFLTLVRKGSTFQNDGSISWHGEVQETGERA